ncbi:energy-coupling factor ABC transporter ATP-binding protein [Desulfomicrobium baculatum]|uniref:ABC transporter related n=1 Tax=Desulfomicrobium baculatum (strain DSM 4028 / VKM B-1378 / X) TaxID=525897 RepID=C7LPZ4_DESBD|nr:ATP-binding cassette domain-containing protein [Desulfomicrobium baculatum]ACU91476.1 ABC transporter related [Desulfomicrobium baculatum DSM 4028]
MSLFELRDVRVAYDGRVVLDLPRLNIEEGEAYSLQGPNGAGKSTLLGILSFLNAPHQGQVRFEGGPVFWKESALRALRRNVGLVEQHPVMFSRSVRENVGYGLTIRGVDKARRERLVDEALDLVGLAHLAGSYAPRLSGGETQRVAIARSLASRPKVLLLDEPTASVDTQNRVIIEQIVADLRDRGDTTIVLCTHNRSQAAALCPKVIYLEDGRLAARPLSNSYAGQFVDDNGQTWCRIAAGFRVPVPQCGPGRGRVVIEPGVVRLSVASAPGLNRGILTRVRLEGDMVSLSVDLGRPLHVQMGLKEFWGAGLEIGALVQAEIPAAAVECFTGS